MDGSDSIQQPAEHMLGLNQQLGLNLRLQSYDGNRQHTGIFLHNPLPDPLPAGARLIERNPVYFSQPVNGVPDIVLNLKLAHGYLIVQYGAAVFDGCACMRPLRSVSMPTKSANAWPGFDATSCA